MKNLNFNRKLMMALGQEPKVQYKIKMLAKNLNGGKNLNIGQKKYWSKKYWKFKSKMEILFKNGFLIKIKWW